MQFMYTASMPIAPAPILIPVPPGLDQQARERIQSWIASTGVTQTELATRIGRNQAWMSRYLKGEIQAADLETLQKIAQTFGFTLIALLDLPRDPHEARLVEEFRALPPRGRASLLDFLATLRQARARKPRT
jgi:transcriptional regulator with XRE-family HTH domain